MQQLRVLKSMWCRILIYNLQVILGQNDFIHLVNAVDQTGMLSAEEEYYISTKIIAYILNRLVTPVL